MASPEGVRTVRVHRILSHAEHGNLIVAAFFEHGASGAGKPAPRGHFAVLDAARGAIVARPEPADLHAASVRAMAFCGCAGRVFLVTVADDKDIRLWALPAEGQGDKATLLGSKTLVKRGNAAVIVPAKDEGWFEAGHEADPDGSPVVLVADKFGDLYRLSFNDIRKPKPVLPQTRVRVLEGEADSATNLLLGHVSMLTDVITNTDHSMVFTADRDEHIRISQYPKTYNIEGYLLGHTQYVSNIRLFPQSPSLLLSGGGDSFLLLWDVARQKPVAKLDLRPVVDSKGGLTSAAEAAAHAAGLAKAAGRKYFHPKPQYAKREEGAEEGAPAGAPEEEDDDERKIAVARISIAANGTVAVLLENFPHVIVFRPSPAGSKLPVDPNPEVIDLNGVQPIDCVFDGTGRLWLSTLEGAPLSLMERAEDGWKAASDPALEAFNSEAIPLKPLEGKGATDLAVDFFPFGKVRKRIGEDDEEGEEGAGGEDQNQGGEGSKRGRKRGKR